MFKFVLSILLSIFIITSQGGFIYAHESGKDKKGAECLKLGIEKHIIKKSNKLINKSDFPEKNIHARISKKSARLLGKNFLKQPYVPLLKKNLSTNKIEYNTGSPESGVSSIYLKNSYISLIGIIKNIN